MSPTAVLEPVTTPSTDDRFELLALALAYESPLNPRKTFNEAEDARLAASVKEKGIIEPLVVRPGAKGMFEIICGARRKRAAVVAELTHVPVIVRSYTDAQAVEIMAIENGQRASVPPLEEALGYKKLLLIDKTYTAAMIATKIGHDERYVWNRLRLLEAIPEVQQLLRLGLIGVEHAEILAKLKESDQKRAISKQNGGLFTSDYALEFDDRPRAGSSAYDRVKPVSVRELRQWVATHVRLDVDFAAKAAPLEFGETAQRVVIARSDDTRGKAPISITFSHMCPDGAKDKDERTYGVTAWKKAETKDGAATCEYARLGVVVAGEHYGESFHVCINRDKCLVHWKESVKAKEKAATLREKGQTKQAAKVEKNSAQREQENWKKQQAKREAERKAWDALEPHIVAEAVAQVKGIKALTPAHAKYLLDTELQFNRDELPKHLGASWFKTPVAAILVTAVHDFYNSSLEDYVEQIAKPLGLDIKRLEAIRDKHQPKAETPAPKKAAKKR